MNESGIEVKEPKSKLITFRELDPIIVEEFLPGWNVAPPNGTREEYWYTREYKTTLRGGEKAEIAVEIDPPSGQVSLFADFIVAKAPVFWLDDVGKVKVDQDNGAITFFSEDRKSWYRISKNGNVHECKQPYISVPFTIKFG